MTRGAWWAPVHRVAELDMTEATEHTSAHNVVISIVEQIEALGML